MHKRRGSEVITPRERSVLQLIAAGKSTKQVAYDLGIRFKTAACHRTNLLTKFKASNTAEMLMKAVESRVLEALPERSEPGVPLAVGPVDQLIERAMPVTIANREARKSLAESIAKFQGLIRDAARAREELRETRLDVSRTLRSLGYDIDLRPGGGKDGD